MRDVAGGPHHGAHGHRHDATGQPVPPVGILFPQDLAAIKYPPHPHFLGRLRRGHLCCRHTHRERLDLLGQVEQGLRGNNR